MSPSTKTIEAAGGVVWRAADGWIEVLLVHRPKYDDWSLPKGKLDPGESAEEAARREVAEETGLVCDLGGELATARYRDRKNRPKRVRYWAMQVRRGRFAANEEVDRVRWVPAHKVGKVLSYEHDADVVSSLIELLVTR